MCPWFVSCLWSSSMRKDDKDCFKLVAFLFVVGVGCALLIGGVA